MAARYRVLHRKKSALEAILKGRTYTDWYVAQRRGWFGWTDLGIFDSVAAAEQACEDHAGGRLIEKNTRVVSEFERRD